MRRMLVIPVLIGFVFLVGCGGTASIKKTSQDYQENIAAIKDFARITGDDWLFFSGILQGALEKDQLPSWVFEELREIDAWFLDEEGNQIEGKVLTEFELGYLTGIRFKLMAPIVRGAIEQYAPSLLGMTEIVAVLAFLGI